MRVLHNNVLVTEHKTENVTESGLILSGSPSGSKPAVVIASGEGVDLEPKQIIYLDWSKALAVTIDGLQCAVIDFEHVKLVL